MAARAYRGGLAGDRRTLDVGSARANAAIATVRGSGMTVVLVFGVTLLVAVLFSELAGRSVLSASVIFLVVGFVTSRGVLGWLPFEVSTNPVLGGFATTALVTVLFTDGMRTSANDLRGAWYLPGRALLFGMPLTIGATAVFAHLVVGLDWLASFLLGSVLGPTDPVLASAIVGREEVPARLRQLLNVESGFNDGLALPAVTILLGVAETRPVHAPTVIADVLLGVFLGVVVPIAALKLRRIPVLGLVPLYEPLFPLAIGMIVVGLAALLHGNEFLAAFAAGITIATVGDEVRDWFQSLGPPLGELVKLAALFVFGALMSPSFFASAGWRAWAFCALAIFVARPAALAIALLGSSLDRRERIVAAWFGPKGFASIVFGLLVFQSGIEQGHAIGHLAGLVIAGSIVLHSSTDVVVARWFREKEPESTT
jgi:NhaP-type Na+/H+ or K+/H+ antiporter